MNQKKYQKMWNDFAYIKSKSYLSYKFNPNHRIGLTNYLREYFIYNFVDPKKNDIVLDIGCASGRQLFQLAPKIKNGYGIDIAKNFIKEAKKIQSNLGINNLFFTQAPLERLPYIDGFFNKIICAEVLEHVFDKEQSLVEILRVLKPDGNLIITVPNLNADGTLWGRFLRFLSIRKFIPIDKFSEKDIRQHGDAHVREFSKDSIIVWTKEHDLKIEKINFVSFLDGPYGDFILKVLLHIPILQKIIIFIEKQLTNIGFNYGRHLIIKIKK